MVRRAFLEKGAGADPATRGTGDFVRVRWDKALDLVAKELQARRREIRARPATFAGSYGWKSPGKLHNCQNLLRRMMNLKGGFVNTSGDYSTGAAQVIMPHVVGTLEVYEQQTVWPVVVDKYRAHGVLGRRSDDHQPDRLAGRRPRRLSGPQGAEGQGHEGHLHRPGADRQPAHYLNAEWIAPRPQTDVALMLGIAHTLVAEKLHDEKFLADYTTGFDKFLPYLMGEERQDAEDRRMGRRDLRRPGRHDQGPGAAFRQEPHHAGQRLVDAAPAPWRAGATGCW